MDVVSCSFRSNQYLRHTSCFSPIQVYEGAVYMHQGVTHLVKDLDLSRKIAFCQKADLKYYTKTRDYTDIIVTGGDLVCIAIKPCMYSY